MRLLIVGATGLVGRTFLSLFENYNLNIELEIVASEKSLGKKIKVNKKYYKIKRFNDVDLDKIDFACIMTNENISRAVVPKLLEKHIVVIDNSSAFRNTTPLTIPEINFIPLQQLYVNPNCCIIQSLLPLYHIDKTFDIDSITYNTYQSCSGGGKHLVQNLIKKKFINCHPLIGEYTTIDDNSTEELKMIYETQKILNKKVDIVANCVRVPTNKNHLVNIVVTTKKQCTKEEITSLLNKKSTYIDTKLIPNSILDETIYCCRLKIINNNKFSFYTYANNLIRGASYNSLKILLSILNYPFM